MKFTFESLYKATEETLKTVKKPFVKNKNKRALEASIDSITEKKLELEETINKELQVISEGKVINVQNIIVARRQIKECEEMIEEVLKLKEEFFEEK